MKKLYYTTGRRKSAIARIVLKTGQGNIVINNKPLNLYFKYYLDQKQVLIPFIVSNLLNQFDCNIKVVGGGRIGQVDAIKLGIARAICLENPSKRTLLKQKKLLSRDDRTKERRKYGLKKARKASQYSKR